MRSVMKSAAECVFYTRFWGSQGDQSIIFAEMSSQFCRGGTRLTRWIRIQGENYYTWERSSTFWEHHWDGWMASPTQWTWVWVNSRSWWWTGRPGVLQFMGSQRVGHDCVTELNWTEGKFIYLIENGSSWNWFIWELVLVGEDSLVGISSFV